MGNKLDLKLSDAERLREVPEDLAREFTEDRNLIFAEVSFATEENLYGSLEKFLRKYGLLRGLLKQVLRSARACRKN